MSLHQHAIPQHTYSFRTADDGTVLHMGEMWVKAVDAQWNVEHFDWTAKYDALRKVLLVTRGQRFIYVL
jgi:hypothetical protein